MAESRKAFIARAGAAGAGALVSTSALGLAAPSPSPSPSASPTPSPAATEIAAQMRRFDPSLTDDQLREIARGIDEQNHYAAQIRKKQPLHNGDEPAPEFSVR